MPIKPSDIECINFLSMQARAQNPRSQQQPRQDGQFGSDNMRVELPPAYDESGRLV